MSSKFRRGFLKICVFSRSKDKKRFSTLNTITTNSSYMAVSSSTNQQNQQISNTKQCQILSISLDDLRILKRNKKSLPRQILRLDQKFFSSNSLNYHPRQLQGEMKIISEPPGKCLFKISNNKCRQKKKTNVKLMISKENKGPVTLIPLLHKN